VRCSGRCREAGHAGGAWNEDDVKTRSTGWRRWLAARVPPPPTADLRQRLRAVLGAAVGLLACGLAGRWAGGAGLGPVPWLVAPLGASAVLVFAVPSSPLAQPWSVIGGNTSSALWGMACVATIPDPTVAAAVAVAGAIALMFLLRCLHPPGGAAALLAVLVHATDLRYATVSVLANSVILVLAGRAYQNPLHRG
jgi:CBS domain-containing membrane protein